MDWTGLASFIIAITGLVAAVGGFIKIWYDVHQLRKEVDGLSDKRTKEANDAGIDRGGMEERARADEREAANPTIFAPKKPKPPNDPSSHM